MYSVVMMMVLSGTPDAVSFGGRHGCGGCHGCHGCYGCCGGCYGCYGCYGCCGGCYGYGCYGCYGGCYGCYGGGRGGYAYAPMVGGGYAMNTTSSAATIVVSLPADARLAFDGAPTTSTSTSRRFVTPALSAGDYTYTLTAEVLRDGKKLLANQTVTVRAGQTTDVRMNESTFSTAMAMK